MSNLMQLNFDLNQVMDLIRNNDGVLTPETEKQLETIQKEIVHKVDNVGLSVVLKQKEIEGLKNFEYMISEKRRSLENELKRFKTFLADTVHLYGQDEGLSTRSMSGKVVRIKDATKEVLTYTEERVPAYFKTNVITLEVPQTETLTKSIQKFLEKYSTKQNVKVNTELATPKDEGFGSEVVKSVTFLGLKKLEVKEIE